MAIISHKVEGVANDVTHYARVYPVNKKGHAQSELDGQIASALTNAFPAEPSSYALIGTYSSSQTFTAPEDGYYQIEVYGASGNGGAASKSQSNFMNEEGTGPDTNIAYGGGGGGGGYAKSIVKLNKGDTVILSGFSIGSTTSAVISSSQDSESSITMSITSGGNGGNGSASRSSAVGGSGGSGGKATGGNVSNINGGNGYQGMYSYCVRTGRYKSGGTATYTKGGGPAAVSGGNTGGNAGKSGLPGFIKIYRGDTNVVAA